MTEGAATSAMVELTQRTTRRAGVTLVRAVVENESSERQRVTLAVEPDGAVWPPRRRGVPAAGWSGNAVALTVDAGNARGVGFATPEPVDGRALSVASTTARGRRGDAPGVEAGSGRGDDPLEGASGERTESTADGVVRALGAFAPPLAAVPRADDGATGDCQERP